MSPEKILSQRLLKGIPVSEGIAIGQVWILESPWDEVVPLSLEESSIIQEMDRYRSAIEEVEKQLNDCYQRVHREIGEEEANIFKAHLYILNDPFFQSEIKDSIRLQKKNAEYLLKNAIEHWSQSLLQSGNDYLRYRIDDIRDVGIRILRVLLQTEDTKFHLDEPAILVAHNLTPSDTARIDRKMILGFISELGGKTSHVSILARSMGLPAVVGIDRLMKKAKAGQKIIVDGNTGIVYIDPPEHIVQNYGKRKNQFTNYWKRLSKDIKLAAITTDHEHISLQANVSMIADVSLAMQYKSDGIGLFRTELPFLIAGKLLSEEEQFDIYRTVVETMAGKVVTIRTLDLGGDKFLPFQGVQKESNPFMGWRSIRIFLQEKDVFKTQLRAILRASQFGKIKILYPMISSLEEIIEFEKIMKQTQNEFKKKKIPFDQSIQCGIMVEVPSIAIIADRVIEYTDFFSIGTNDLIQYTLAVDRNNEKVAKFYQPLNPAIIQLLYRTIQAAIKAQKPVSICGEMAGNPLYTVMLLGFGLRQFSMSPLMIPEIKERIRAISIEECEEVARKILEMNSTEKIEKFLWDFHNEINQRQSVPYFKKADVQISEESLDQYLSED